MVHFNIKPYLLLVLSFSSYFILNTNAQNELDFRITLEATYIDSLPGIQSYAFAQYGDEWLIIGGRRDGLHERRPFEAFQLEHNNKEILVIQPDSGKMWRRDLSSLKASISEQLAATNFQFAQKDNFLFLTGGYSFSIMKDEHITYPYISIIDIPALIHAVKNDLPIDEFIVQFEDERFCRTGGRLDLIDDRFYLIGGHKFMGSYNPMGPDSGPGFVQEYKESILSFETEEDDGTHTLHNFKEINDSFYLHKRDFNLLPAITNDQEALFAFSGVFRHKIDLPFYNVIEVMNDSFSVVPDFKHYFNQYHTACVSLYSRELDFNNFLFFGGISQFYFDGDTLVQDNDVPFVKTISSVNRSDLGEYEERVLDIKMPDFFGAASEFIVNSHIPIYNNGVIDLDKIKKEKVLLGYILGGIRSDERNVLFEVPSESTEASSTLFKVYYHPAKSMKFLQNPERDCHIDVNFYPLPSEQSFLCSLQSEVEEEVQFKLKGLDGEVLYENEFTLEASNIRWLESNIPAIDYGTELILEIKYSGGEIFRKVVIDD